MKIAQINTRCECQGWLTAQVDEAGRVVSGSARKGRGELETAPAIALYAGHAQFQIGWLCPICGRNTLRSFERAGLSYREPLAGAVVASA